MSTILGSLANATKALNAHSYGITTAGANLANVNNPEYSRQRVELGERGTIMTVYGPEGLGVEVVGFSQMRDQVLDRQILRESSINASLEAQQAALSKAEASIGQEINRTDDSAFIDGATSNASGSGGLAESINSFFNAFHSLSANPASAAEKESLVQKADILAEKLNVTAERLGDLKEDLTLQARTDLAEANRLIDEIARLNTEVARAEAHHAGQALTLRDTRQARLEDLSKLMQVKVENIEDSGGQIRVYIPTVNGANPSYDLVSRGHSSVIEMDDSGVSPRFSIASDDTQIEIRGGSIHGALTARDGAIQQYSTGLDRLAAAFVTEVNGLYNTGVAPSVTNFFTDTGDPAELTALGISLDSTVSSSTLRTTNDPAQLAGDNALVLAIAELDDSALASLGGWTFGAHYRSIATNLGENASKVQSRLQDEGIVLRLLQEQQDGVSGVSIDEEMTDMMKFQRAYQATGKLIAAIDEMLDVVINRLI